MSAPRYIRLTKDDGRACFAAANAIVWMGEHEADDGDSDERETLQPGPTHEERGHGDRGDVDPLPARVQPGLGDELRVRPGGDHHDLVVPVGAPELLHRGDGAADLRLDPGEQFVGPGSAQADQPHDAAVADDQWRRRGSLRGLWRPVPAGAEQDRGGQQLPDEDHREDRREPAAQPVGQ